MSLAVSRERKKETYSPYFSGVCMIMINKLWKPGWRFLRWQLHPLKGGAYLWGRQPSGAFCWGSPELGISALHCCFLIIHRSFSYQIILDPPRSKDIWDIQITKPWDNAAWVIETGRKIKKHRFSRVGTQYVLSSSCCGVFLPRPPKTVKACPSHTSSCNNTPPRTLFIVPLLCSNVWQCVVLRNLKLVLA